LKVQVRFWLAILIFSACFGLRGGVPAYAQAESGSTQSASAAAPHEQRKDSEESDEFRHAPIVQSIAGALHLSVETTARLFELLNSGILIFAILFFIARALPKALRARTATIQKKLVEAREATAGANERLTAVEAKLAKIGEDIEAIRQGTERDLVEDEKRIRQSLADEQQRIVKAAEQEIESAGASAKRELKRFAAELAIEGAAKRIQLAADSDRAIIERFGGELASQFGKGGRN